MTELRRLDLPATTLRAANDPDDRRFTGIAIPYHDTYEMFPGMCERIAPRAVIEYDPVLCYRHDEPIGRIEQARETEAGWEITARVSDTSKGRDALTLVRDDAVTGLSIGFTPVESSRTDDDAGTTITHNKIIVREVSIVPIPAYTQARITEHRERNHHMTTEEMPTATRADIDSIRAELADMQRSLTAQLHTTDRPSIDKRSVGTLVNAALNGDDTAREVLARAYTGGTSADDYGKPTWTGDVLQIIEQADPLAGVFATGVLPTTGMQLEFGRLKSNTVKVARQVKEGDALPLGNVSVETASVPVSTYGGASKMTVQEMTRATAPLVDMHFRALALAAGQARVADALAAVNKAATANSATAITVTGGSSGWKPWVPAIVKASKTLRQLGLGISGLLLPETEWTAIAQLDDGNGRPLNKVDENDATIGAVEVQALDGRLLTVPTRMVEGLKQPVFFNKSAIRFYSAPLVRVTNDLSALDLTSPLGVYQFGAYADEIPAAIIPVTLA